MRYTRTYPSIPFVCMNRSGTYYRYSEQLDENGIRQKTKVQDKLDFYYKETNEVINFNQEGKVEITGIAYCRGDIDPSGEKIIGEIVWDNGEVLEVFKGRRNANPDTQGSINHTKLYLR